MRWLMRYISICSDQFQLQLLVGNGNYYSIILTGVELLWWVKGFMLGQRLCPIMYFADCHCIWKRLRIASVVDRRTLRQLGKLVSATFPIGSIASRRHVRLVIFLYNEHAIKNFLLHITFIIQCDTQKVEVRLSDSSAKFYDTVTVSSTNKFHTCP